VLRAAGPNPLRISVTDQADIGGWIDASGVPGGFLRFDADEPTKPLPGVGGPGGAGGSRGGDGGTVEFANGNAGDKNPENTVPVNGGAGEAPPLTPDGLDETPGEIGTGSPDDGFAEGPSFTRATAGLSLRGQNCQTCEATAGGGGSGGNLRAGEDGQAHKGFDNQGQPIPNLDISGKAATAFGTDELRYGGDYWLLGGLSGSGGGGNPHVSDDYAQGRIPGSYRFKSSALYAPGTGGGGGGGAIHLVARNLTIRGSAKIRARGGNSYQSIDLGGNGGAGAGGTIFIQVQNALTLEPGAVIDVSGGLANLAPPTLGGQTVPEYPGNIRAVGGQTTNLGGIGGNGPPGRIRMEADSRSVALLTGANASVSSGPFYVSTVPGLAVSRALRVGVGDSGVASSHAMRLDTPNVLFFEFGQPAGTDSQVLWEGARDSLDQHAAVSPFEQGILDPRNLVNREFVRFQVPFLTNVALQRTQTLNEISLPFRLPSPTD
jgi:hypothetical protein